MDTLRAWLQGPVFENWCIWLYIRPFCEHVIARFVLWM